MRDTVATRQKETNGHKWLPSEHLRDVGPGCRILRQRRGLATSGYQWTLVLCKVAVGLVLARK